MEEFLSQQQYQLASVCLAGVLTSLIVARIANGLETAGIYSSYDESFWKGTRALLRALCSMFRWSTLGHFFSRPDSDDERGRRLIDNCGGQGTLPLKRSNSTCRRIDSRRTQLGRFKDQWKQKGFKDALPSWNREQQRGWETNVCKLYMDAMVRDHDALLGELAESEQKMEKLKEEMHELNLRVDQNRNWYCKVWNMYRPGDVVKKAPMSMAKAALRQSDLWETMYRQHIADLMRQVEGHNLQLEKTGEKEQSLWKQINGLKTELKVEREKHQKAIEQQWALVEELQNELANALEQVPTDIRDDQEGEAMHIEDEDEDELRMASLDRRKRGASKESNSSKECEDPKELSTELAGVETDEDEMALSWT